MNTTARSCALAITLIAGALTPLGLYAENGSNPGTFSFLFENDVFYDADRNYTSGLQISWTPRTESPPDWAERTVRRVPWIPQDGQIRHGYALGQSIFTPHDITLANPPNDDRPYAGWLYGAIGLSVEAGRQLDQFSLTLGIVGPEALAEQTQKLIHDHTGEDEPLGWDNQLKSEPGIVLTHQHSWRQLATATLEGFDLELTPHMGGTLGNIYTYANAGLTLRYGKSLRLDYGPPRVQISVPGAPVFEPRSEFGWYLFSGVEGRAIARNLFLDGNTFRDSRSVDKEPLVGELQFGIVLDGRAARLSFTHVLRTREFENQSADNQDFGAVSFSLLF